MSYDGKGRFDFIDLKQAVLDVSVKKAQGIDSAKDWSVVQWDLRKRLLKSMSEGDVLVLQMSTACPPLTRFSLMHPHTARAAACPALLCLIECPVGSAGSSCPDS